MERKPTSSVREKVLIKPASAWGTRRSGRKRAFKGVRKPSVAPSAQTVSPSDQSIASEIQENAPV